MKINNFKCKDFWKNAWNTCALKIQDWTHLPCTCNNMDSKFTLTHQYNDFVVCFFFFFVVSVSHSCVMISSQHIQISLYTLLFWNIYFVYINMCIPTWCKSKSNGMNSRIYTYLYGVWSMNWNERTNERMNFSPTPQWHHRIDIHMVYACVRVYNVHVWCYGRLYLYHEFCLHLFNVSMLFHVYTIVLCGMSECKCKNA